MPKVPKKKVCNTLQYLKKNVEDQADFLPADKHQGLLQIDTIILIVVAGHPQITQSKKFSISLQYLEKEVSDEVDILHTDKHESFLQNKTVIFVGGWLSIPKVSKIASLQCLYNISKKEVRDKLIFCINMNIKVSYNLISTLWT